MKLVNDDEYSTCPCTFANLSMGKLYSFNGTLAIFKNLKKPSSLGNKNSKLLPDLPARAVRPTRWI
jgi:hypothetical protein